MPDRILDYCGAHFGASLSAQRPFALPGDKPHYARDRAVDVRHITLEIRIDPQAKRIEGACSTTFVPINDGLRQVEFDAVEMEVRDVRLEGRRARLNYTYDGARLRIDLGSVRKAGEELTTVVPYSPSPPPPAPPRGAGGRGRGGTPPAPPPPPAGRGAACRPCSAPRPPTSPRSGSAPA